MWRYGSDGSTGIYRSTSKTYHRNRDVAVSDPREDVTYAYVAMIR